jgi:hypothetical protein
VTGLLAVGSWAYLVFTLPDADAGLTTARSLGAKARCVTVPAQGIGPQPLGPTGSWKASPFCPVRAEPFDKLRSGDR